MDSSRQRIDFEYKDSNMHSRRDVLCTTAALGFGTLVGTGRSRAQSDRRIEYGSTVSGTTEEEWFFDASVGDKVSIEMRPDDPVNNSADIDLLNPSGDVVEGAISNGEDGNAVITRYEIERRQDGEYTIIASGDESFSYELSLYEGVPIDETIQYGATVESELTRDNRYFSYATFSGYHETYAFEASVGDKVSIEVRPNDPVTEAAQIELLDPEGDPVEGVGSSGEDGNAALTRYEIERGQGGQYTIVASGADQTDLFGYEISLYEGVPIDQSIEYGTTVESEFTRDNRYYQYATFSGYHETYAFEASAGDEVSIEVKPDAPDEEAQIRLLNSAGDPVEGIRPTNEDGNAVISEDEIDQDGQYIIVASGDDQTDLFEYTLELRLENRSEQTETSVETASATETTVQPDTTVETDTITITETTSPTETSTPTETRSETSTTAEITSSSGPGFTVGGTLTALCSVGYALKRALWSESDEE